MLFSCLALVACSPDRTATGGNDQTTQGLTIFAAASLTDAFTELGASFEQSHGDVTLQFNFGGSQNLRTQIEQGARADVFACADPVEMGALASGGLVGKSASRVFLTNQMIVVMPAGNPAGITSLADLGAPGLKIVLAAEEVPAGRYARQAIENLGEVFGPTFPGRVLENVVSNEDNSRQVVAKVELGEADAGIVYVSDAVAAHTLQTLRIPDAANVAAQYQIAALTDAARPQLAEAFIAHVLSSEGQTVLRRWGFTPILP
jgi:molybdate transport system substrate-binding protein